MRVSLKSDLEKSNQEKYDSQAEFSMKKTLISTGICHSELSKPVFS